MPLNAAATKRRLPSGLNDKPWIWPRVSSVESPVGSRRFPCSSTTTTEQQPCFVQQVVAIGFVAHGADLQRDDATVLAVERLDGPVGQTQLVFRDADARHPRTEVDDEPPVVTPRELDVLVSLCRPVLAHRFTEPASIKTIAAELSVSEAAVKQDMTNLFAKFGCRST